MQADGRFVQNVTHADQSAPDLRGQSNALRLATRQRRTGPFQGQVPDPHFFQKLQPMIDFAEYLLGDDFLFLGQLELREKLERIVDIHPSDFVDALFPQKHRSRLGTKPSPATGFARQFTQISMKPLLDVFAIGVVPTPLQIRNHALKRNVEFGLVLFIGAVDQDALHVFGQVPKRCFR